MKEYTVKRLLKSLDADPERLAGDLLESSITGISTDSRDIRKGDVFFALRGNRYDGADFVERAFARDALCAVVNADSMKNGFGKLPVVPVRDTVRALGDAARDYRSLFTGDVIAVTGTSGKTTVKEMMLAVLGRQLQVHGTKGNYNNHIGLPLSVFGLGDTHECAVFELGASAPGEIAYLAGIVRPHVGVILNVGPAHIEFFHSIDAVADAKMELIDMLGNEATAVINGDDELLRSSETRCTSRLVRFGINGPWDYRAEHVVVHPDGCASFDIEGHRITLKVRGLHNVYNALAAYAVGMLMGVAAGEAVEALEAFTAPAMRMQIITKRGVLFIDDSYNANPMSMACAAEVLRTMEIPEGGRKIAVLGDMLELGELSEDAHYRAGKMFAALGLSWFCLVGENSAHYERGAVENGMESEMIKRFRDADAAARFVQEITRPGDVILVKGSRAVGMEKILTGDT